MHCESKSTTENSSIGGCSFQTLVGPKELQIYVLQEQKFRSWIYPIAIKRVITSWSPVHGSCLYDMEMLVIAHTQLPSGIDTKTLYPSQTPICSSDNWVHINSFDSPETPMILTTDIVVQLVNLHLLSHRVLHFSNFVSSFAHNTLDPIASSKLNCSASSTGTMSGWFTDTFSNVTRRNCGGIGFPWKTPAPPKAIIVPLATVISGYKVLDNFTLSPTWECIMNHLRLRRRNKHQVSRTLLHLTTVLVDTFCKIVDKCLVQHLFKSSHLHVWTTCCTLGSRLSSSFLHTFEYVWVIIGKVTALENRSQKIIYLMNKVSNIMTNHLIGQAEVFWSLAEISERFIHCLAYHYQIEIGAL